MARGFALASIKFLPILAVLGSLLLALFTGLLANVLPWWLLVAAALIPLALAFTLKSSKALIFWGLAGVLLVPLYKFQDVLFLAVCAWGAWLAYQRGVNPLQDAVAKALVSFLLLALLTSAFGYVFNGNSIENIYRDGRVFMYWMLFPLVFVFFGKEDRANQVSGLLVGLGVLIAAIAVFQGVTGISFLGAGRVAALDSSGMDPLAGSVNRVQIAGFPFVTAAILVLWAQHVNGVRLPAWKYGAFLVLAAGLYFNFGRAVWAWTALAMFMIAAFGGMRGMASIAALAVVGGVMALVIAVFTDSIAVEMVYKRLTSVGSEGGYGTSYGWRELENIAAIKALADSYGAGVGVGGEYRDFYIPLRHFPDHVRYIHQGHLGLMLKVSVLGWLLIMLTLLLSVWLGLRKLPFVKESRSLGLAASFHIIAMILLNNTQPVMLSHDGVMAGAAMLAVLSSLREST